VLSLDIRTLVFVAHLTALAMALVFLLVARGNRISGQAMVLWGLAFLTRSLGLLLIYLRGTLPPMISMGVANALALLSFLLMVLGFQTFLGHPSPWRRHLAFAGLIVLWVAGLHAWASYSHFVAGISLVIVLLEFWSAWLLFGSPIPGMGFFQRGLAILLLLEALVMLCRMGWHLKGSGPVSLFTPSLMVVSVYLELILHTVFFGTSLLGLVYQRAHLKKLELIAELEATLAKVHTLEGLLPICAWCKKIRDEDGHWHGVEDYVSGHSGAAFTHGICPECRERFQSE